MSEPTAKEVMNDFKSCDLLSDCSAGPLRPDYIRKSIYNKQFMLHPFHLNWTEMISIKREFKYISIKDSLENLLKNKSVQNEYQCTKFLVYHGNHKPGEEKVLHDITDGAVFKANIFFHKNPHALKTNPL